MIFLLEIIMGAVLIGIYVVPAILALILATFAAKLFSKFFSPVTELVKKIIGSGDLSNPLDDLHLFYSVRGYFGTPKNILFICFVIIFLIFHYRSLGNVGDIYENFVLLFPGSAVEQVATSDVFGGKLDFGSFVVNPESYLQIIIYSFITGLFMKIGCTTKADDAEIAIPVKLLYTLLITVFSAVVLEMLPSDLFYISIPEISLELHSLNTYSGDSDALMLLETLWQWAGILLEKLVSLIPTIVAFYFLCNSISGFTAAFLGGFVALFAVALALPEGFADQNSFGAVLLLLFMLAAGEVVALTLSEMVSDVAEAFTSENGKIFTYYNIVTLLIAYFFYPLFGLAVLFVIAAIVNGFNFSVFLVCLAGLIVFSLVTFAGYRLNRWLCEDSGSISGGEYTAAMIFNIPIWIIYIVLFAG
jgi:hypothetical protein